MAGQGRDRRNGTSSTPLTLLRDLGGQSKEGQDIIKEVRESQDGARMVSELCQQREAAEVASDGGSDSVRRGCTGARRTVPSGAGRDWEGLGHHSPSWPPGGPSAAGVAEGEPAGGARRKLSVETIIATKTLLAVSQSLPDPVRSSVWR